MTRISHIIAQVLRPAFASAVLFTATAASIVSRSKETLVSPVLARIIGREGARDTWAREGYGGSPCYQKPLSTTIPAPVMSQPGLNRIAMLPRSLFLQPLFWHKTVANPGGSVELA